MTMTAKLLCLKGDCDDLASTRKMDSCVWSRVTLRVFVFIFLAYIGFKNISQEEYLSGMACDKTRTMKRSMAANVSLPSSSSSEQSAANEHHIAFHLRDNDFVQEVADCLHSNSTCHIIYRHVGKTGGTGIQNFFWKLLDIPSRDTCCNHKMIQNFRNDSADYCAQPFQSYEVFAGFDRMVQTCDEEHYQRTETNGRINNQVSAHRLIILTTLREPAERLLSKIHQWCNKNIEKRDPEFTAACQRCNFVEDEDRWMKIAREQGSKEDRVMVKQSLGSLYDYPHLWLDLSDINTMIRQLRSHFSQPQHQAVFDWYFGQQHNPESFTTCRFLLDSGLFKGLGESKAVYKDFLTGRLWQKKINEEINR